MHDWERAGEALKAVKQSTDIVQFRVCVPFVRHAPHSPQTQVSDEHVGVNRQLSESDGEGVVTPGQSNVLTHERRCVPFDWQDPHSPQLHRSALQEADGADGWGVEMIGWEIVPLLFGALFGFLYSHTWRMDGEGVTVFGQSTVMPQVRLWRLSDPHAFHEVHSHVSNVHRADGADGGDEGEAGEAGDAGLDGADGAVGAGADGADGAGVEALLCLLRIT